MLTGNARPVLKVSAAESRLTVTAEINSVNNMCCETLSLVCALNNRAIDRNTDRSIDRPPCA